VLISGFGRSGKAKGDIPGVRFKVVKVSGVGLLALWKEKKVIIWTETFFFFPLLTKYPLLGKAKVIKAHNRIRDKRPVTCHIRLVFTLFDMPHYELHIMQVICSTHSPITAAFAHPFLHPLVVRVPSAS
jgi:hypothetical protein